MADYVICVKNVYKSFKEHFILHNISIDFEKHKIHGLIGRNGSGKTMLLKCICGLTTVSAGEISVNGSIIGRDVDMPEQVGIIVETPGFLPNYTGFKNLKFLAGIHKVISRKEIKGALKRVGLDPNNKKKVSKYSLGMKQRLGIAQAIMERPSILLLDEPLNGIDKHGVHDMRELFLQLRSEGTTILLASHHAEDVDLLCDKVYEMEQGRLSKVR